MANFFPRWTNWLPLKLAICGFFVVCGLTAGTWYYVTPKRAQHPDVHELPFAGAKR